MLNPNLQRLLRKIGLQEGAPPPTPEIWAQFLDRVARAYDQADHHRSLVARSLEISSREMQRLREALRLSEREASAQRDRLQAVLASLGAGVCVLDPAGGVLSINPEGVRLLGWSEAELVGRGFADLVADGAAALASAIRAGAPQRGEDAVFRRADGAGQPVAHSLTPLLEEGRPVGSVLVFEDVRARTEAVAALRESEHRLRESEEMFRHMAEGIEQVYWVTEAGEKPFLYVSPAFGWIWGRDPKALLENPALWVESVHAEDRERVVRAAAEKKETGRYDETYRIVRPDGGVRWVRDRAFPVRAADGRVRRVYGVTEDVTDLHAAEAKLRQSEQQLRQAQKLEAIGRLAGAIAHDFNNLLTVIQGYAETVRGTIDRSERAWLFLGQILEASRRASELTRRLLAFSRRQPMEVTLLDVPSCVRGLAPMLSRVMGEDVRLVVRAEGQALHTLADPGQIEQVIMNLVVNARDAMPRGGTLTVETSLEELDAADAAQHLDARPGPHVVVSVSDTGVGMGSETLAHLFEPFYTTKEEGKGTGLGLAIVYGIVNQTGGHVRVETAVGKGSTFRVYLPCASAPVSASGVPVAPCPPRAGSETVLVVEDEPQVRALTRAILEGGGYRVLDAPGGREALEVAGRHGGPIDLLLTDVVMPEMSGRELAAALVTARDGLAVLFMSGYTDDADLLQGLRTGEVPFLAKPFTADALLHKVRSVLDGGQEDPSGLPTSGSAAVRAAPAI